MVLVVVKMEEIVVGERMERQQVAPLAMVVIVLVVVIMTCGRGTGDTGLVVMMRRWIW